MAENLDSGLDHGLEYGLEYGLNSRLILHLVIQNCLGGLPAAAMGSCPNTAPIVQVLARYQSYKSLKMNLQ